MHALIGHNLMEDKHTYDVTVNCFTSSLYKTKFILYNKEYIP